MMEEEEELLKRLEAELESVRRKKELAIGQDAYTFYYRREKMLVEEIFQIRTRHHPREQRALIETYPR
jgi:uracil-DNA glycosylase